MTEENFKKILGQGPKKHIYSKNEYEIMGRDFKDGDFDEIDTYKRRIEEGFNKLVCDGTISDFSLDFDNDVDETGVFVVNAQLKMNSSVRYLEIKHTDFPELTQDEVIEMFDEIKTEITNSLENEQPV